MLRLLAKNLLGYKKNSSLYGARLITYLLFWIGPATLWAANEGFHYVPLRDNHETATELNPYRTADFNLLFVYLGDGVYRGHAQESAMLGMGATFHRHWPQNNFVTLSPIYGMHFFVGAPDDISGSARGRLSLQSPLGIGYFFQLIRDEQVDRAYHLGHHLGLSTTLFFPTWMDLTTRSFTFGLDLGAQMSLSYSMPLPQALLTTTAGVTRFFTGMMYLTDDSTGENEWDTLEGEPLDLAASLRYHYLPWRLALGAEFHFTSSVADTQGDSIQIVGLQISYYPKP